jgi:transcription antitermination factor NusG
MAAARRKCDWFVVETGRGLESTAVRHLKRQGYSVYLPRFRERRSPRGVRRVLPLFPSYLFVEVCDLWRSINGTRGVRRILLSAEQVPARMHREVIDGIRDSEDDLGYVRVESEEPPELVVGNSYLVTRGVFAQRRGIFVGTTTEQRCRMLFDMLGRKIESEVPARHLA